MVGAIATFACRYHIALLVIDLSCVLGLAGCGGEDDPPGPQQTGPGSLFVRVDNEDGQAVSGAIVLTRPETERDTTDALGTVLFEELESGVYTAWATHDTIGAGNAPANINAGALTEVTIVLQSDVSLYPSVSISSPDWGESYSYVDTVTVVALVSDLNDDAQGLSLTWSSDLDGTLSTSPAGEDGVAALSATDLSLGEHVIRLEAANADSFVGADSVMIVVAALPPEVTLLLPEDEQAFTPGEEIVFSAHVSDRETPVMELSYEWASDLSGMISSGYPDLNGDILAGTTALPSGEHIITLSVTDADTLTTTASATIFNLLPGPFEQFDAMIQNGQATLTWSETSDPDFDRYTIYRSEEEGEQGDSIGVVTTVEETTFIDTGAPFVSAAYYHVRVYNTHGYFRASEVVEVDNPGGLTLMNEPEAMLLHPTETWIYLDYGGTIFRVDFSSMEILGTGNVASSSGWKSLGDCGQGVEIYCPGGDGWIRILDPVDFSDIASINTGLSTKCAIAGLHGIVYASVMPSPWWEQPLRTYDRVTGAYIDGGGDYSGCRLRLLPSGNEIIEITTGISPVDMDYYRFDDSGTFLEHEDDDQHGATPLDADLFYTSPSGAFVISSNQAAMYSANSSMSYLGLLPRGDRLFEDFTFSADGNMIYAAVMGEQLILAYTYPSMQQTGEIATRTRPLFVERQGDYLVVVGDTGGGSGSAVAAVEVISLGAGRE